MKHLRKVSACSIAKFGILLICLAALATPRAHASALEGQIFEDVVQLANRNLHLNGLGVRKIFFIKAYVAGIYVSEKVSTPQELMTLAGPKRLQLRMLRSAGPDDFNSALVSGMRKNSSEAELSKLNDRIVQLELAIKSIGSTVKGDVINLDYLPDLGTRLAVNGISQSKMIAGADFYAALLSIFVGDKPVDAMLKKGLLGQ
ncbi:MAG: chalcone isomerase family protein [Comamonadaceae bacterium]